MYEDFLFLALGYEEACKMAQSGNFIIFAKRLVRWAYVLYARRTRTDPSTLGVQRRVRGKYSNPNF